jgi:hypothetical protein
MQREDKFGYGFTVGAIGMAYLLDKILGPGSGLIVAFVLTLVGVGFIIAGHQHEKTGLWWKIILPVVVIAIACGPIIWRLAPKSESPIGDNNTKTILDFLRSQNVQAKLLQEYPLGYAIFDVDAVSGAVTPEEAHQGLEAFEFDFRPVKIVENTDNHITIQLPNLLKDGKLFLSDAQISGDKRTMLQYGSGYMFNGVLATGQVMQYNGSRTTWLFGLRRVATPPKRPSSR